MRTLISCLVLNLMLAPSLMAQVLETETARLLPGGGLEVGSNLEYQFSPDGRELAFPVALTYGLTDRWELLVEPVPYTRIAPRNRASVSGLGDLEITLTRQLLTERSLRPALALAGEVKLPTAESRRIGTDQTDYTAYLIASRRFGRLDIHGNIGYTFLGKPAGVRLRNVFDFALAGVRSLSRQLDLYGELLGNTSASPEGSESGPTAEVAGGELVGSLGVRWEAQPQLALSLGVSYDNTGALLLRPGFTMRLH